MDSLLLDSIFKWSFLRAGDLQNFPFVSSQIETQSSEMLYLAVFVLQQETIPPRGKTRNPISKE